MANIMKLGGGGIGAGLNIAYGLTPPTDTSKLWVPLTKKPANVEISGDSLQNAVDLFETKTATLTYGKDSMCAVAINGKIYTFGGGSTASYSNAIEEYDPATDTHISKTATLAAAAGYASAVVINGKAYIFGGVGSYFLNTIQEYDPVTDTCVTKNAKLPTAVARASAVSINGKAYIFGGQYSNNAGGCTNVIQEYDPVADTCETKTVTLDYNLLRTSAVAINGKAYIFGGTTSTASTSSGTLKRIQEYDPIANTLVSKTAKLCQEICGTSAVAINGKAYVFGGAYSYYYDYIQEYDPITDTCETKTVALSSIKHGTAAAVVDGTAYVMGGYNGSVTLHIIDAYTPNAYLGTNCLKIFASVYRGEEYQVVTNIVNGKTAQIKLYMTSAFLGDDEGYAVAQDAYVYDETNSEWQALDGTSMTTDMLNALAELGVT